MEYNNLKINYANNINTKVKLTNYKCCQNTSIIMMIVLIGSLLFRNNIDEKKISFFKILI